MHYEAVVGVTVLMQVSNPAAVNFKRRITMKKNKRVAWVIEVRVNNRNWEPCLTFIGYRKFALKELRSWQKMKGLTYKFRLIKYVPEVKK